MWNLESQTLKIKTELNGGYQGLWGWKNSRDVV